MIQAAVCPNQIIGVELVVLHRPFDHVYLRKHEDVVILQRMRGMTLQYEGIIFQSLLSHTLHNRVKPHFLKGLNFFGDEDSIVRPAAIPYVLLEIFASKDNKIGVS